MTSKRLLFALLLMLAAFGIYDRYEAYERVQRRKKNNFSLEKMAPIEKKGAVLPLKMSVEEAQAVLAQPFFYLAKGKQCVAFASQDGRYVLKFLKKPKMKKEKQAKRALALEKSIELAVSRCPDECGILFAHLNATEGIHPKVTLLDKRGNLLTAEVNDVKFIIQERAQFLKPLLVRLMYEGKEAEAKEKIDELFKVLVSLGKRGIEDNDGALIRNDNIGYLHDRAIILDPGKFVQFSAPLTTEELKHSLRRVQPLSKWLKKHYPTLSEHFEAALGKALIAGN